METSMTGGQVTDASTPGPVVSRWPLTGHSVGRARHELRAALSGWGLDHLADPAELVLSELLTNAVRHARTPAGRLVETRYERLPQGGGIRIEVHDANDRMPQMRRPADDDEGGRGLALVDALTGRRWGVSSRQGVGKLVWALVG
ncbi:ATP-binding protein [Streptomyces sp. NPDC049040]|uniref:ATP-binding protein n=1 Tax=Streptomyces sp. NPDC049040 TaxID=3365593 RepID=UPI0037110219